MHRWSGRSWARDRRSETPARHNDDVREVVDGVIKIPIGSVVVDDGVVLVDTGIPGRADKVARAVEAARRPIGEVHTILLTHCHPDHIGGVAELRAAELASIARLGDLS